jgi:hypothetical protein
MTATLTQYPMPGWELQDYGRFWPKVAVADHGCWYWTAGLTGAGYGAFRIREKGNFLAHRVIYTMLVGQIPSDRELDHLCREPSCCRPDHLEPVTGAENRRRGMNFWQSKTHCPQGHPYDEANTHWFRGHRLCRACNRERCRLRRKKGRAQ